MEHQEAIEIYAAEGYLLDELTDAEREGFEQHYADCESCFADVRDGVRFIHALPAAVKEEKGTHQKRWPSLAAAAAIACAVTAGIGEVVLVGPMRAQMARLRQPQVPKFSDIAMLDARAPGEMQTFKPWERVIFQFDAPLDSAAPYRCVLVDSHDAPQGQPEILAKDQTKDRTRDFNVEVPGLPAGDYKLIVTDAQKHAWRVPFQVR